MPEDAVHPDLATVAADFIAYLAGVRRYSPHTLRAYGVDVREFCRGFALRHGRPATTADLSRQELRAECARVFGRLRASSLARRLSALRTLGDFIILRGLARENQARWMRLPKVGPRLAEVLTEVQAAALCEVTSGRHTVRNQALVEVLYGAGLRVSECLQLDLADLIWEADNVLVRVLGKGQRERQVPAGRAAAAALRLYLSERGPAGGAVFVSRHGRLRDRGVRAMLRTRAAAAGIGPAVWPHLLRHSCATHMLRRGCDLRIIMDQLGHRSLRSTQGYLHLDLGDLIRIYRRAHPRAA
mgnify:CR=1 FL=1